MGEPKKGSSLDIAKMNTTLNPITALPEDQSGPQLQSDGGPVQYPVDIENSLDVIRYTQANSNQRFQTPTVFATDYNQMPDVNWDIENVHNINKRRASEQTGLSQLGGFLNQAIIGEVVGGTLEGVGALGDAVGGLFMGQMPWESDFQNWLTDFGGDIREATKEYTPIYQQNPGKGWDPSDSGWWASNGVSVASTLSLLLPAIGVARGASYAGKGMRYLAGAGKSSRSAMVANASRKLQNAMTAGRATNFVRNSMAMGISMRHMENFREAGETWDHSFQKNLDFLQDPKNFENFINSSNGEAILKQLGITTDDPYVKDKVANHVAGQAAANSYITNWSNVGFDILQAGLWFGPMKLGTRPGKNIFGRHSTKVTKANNATLKAPKVPKTRVGKAYNYIKPIIPPALWAYSEGIEEQINFMSMQEGIRHGDIMMGNTGYENREFMSGSSWVNRMNDYASRGDFWAATAMGTIGGGIFSGIATLKNRKAQAALDQARLKEIGGRADLIQKSLEKRRKAIENGDVQGAREQDEIMALQLSLNSAQAGNMDQLEEMMNDPAFVEMLQETGQSESELATRKADLINILRTTEKKFNTYRNRATSSKWGAGVAGALTELDMSVTMYDKLIKDIDTQIEQNINDDIYNVEQYNIGPNTKQRHQLQMQKRALQDQLSKFQLAQERAEDASEDTTASKEEKEKSKALAENFNQYINNLQDQIARNETEENVLKKSSQETYEDTALREENEFLDKVDKGSLTTLANKKQLFTWHRDAAWNRLQDLLKEENPYYENESEVSALNDIAVVGKERIKEEAENNGIIDDFKEAVKNNPEMTEEQVDEFFAQYPDNVKIQEFYNEFIQSFKQAKEEQAVQQAYEENKSNLNALANQTRQEVRDEIDRKIEQLKQELFNPKLSRRDVSKRIKMEQEWRETQGRATAYLYGDAQSINMPISELFDEVTQTVGVVWGDKVGSIYRDTETNELIFRDGTTLEEYIVDESPSAHNSRYRNALGQFTQGPTLGSLDMLLRRDELLGIEINADGRTFNINGEYFNNLTDNPSDSIEYDKEGNVVSVTLTKWNGKKVTFTSPLVTYELADVIETLEAVKRTAFNNLINDDFLIIEQNGKEYIVSYEQDLFDGALVVKDIDGVTITSEEAIPVRRQANIQLSNAIQETINNIKNKYNEANSTKPAAAPRITENAFSEGQVEQGENSQKAEERITAELNAEGQTSSAGPNASQSKLDITEQGELLDVFEQDIETNQDQIQEITNEGEIPTVQNPDAVIAIEEQNAIIEATEDPKSGKTVAEEETTLITIPGATTKTKTALEKSYPEFFQPQVISVVGPNGKFTQAKDKNGMLMPIWTAPGKKGGFYFKDISELSPSELEQLEDQNNERVQLVYYNPPMLINEKPIYEGGRIVEQNTMAPWQGWDYQKKMVKGQQQVLMVVPDAVKEKDLFDFRLLNSPELGVGTKVLLRIEPEYKYYPSSNTGDMIVTVRLASDPSKVLSVLSRKTAKSRALRAKISEMGNKDIKAVITGKTPGYIINIKKDGKSIQRPIDGDMIIGIGQDQTVRYNNSDVSVSPTSYIEQGRVYIAVPSANGAMIPVRAETALLSEKAIDKVLDIITMQGVAPKEKRELVNKIVYTPVGSRQDQAFKQANSKRILAMDNLVVKIPIPGTERVIGIQYNMEGLGDKMRNNFQDAMNGKPFLFKEYDSQGNIITHELRRSEDISQFGQIPTIIRDYLATKTFNVQKHLINSKQEFFSPLQDGSFKDYNTYLSEMDIVTTDIPGGTSQRFHHSKIYVEVADKVSDNKMPAFFSEGTEVLNTTDIIVETEQDLIVETMGENVDILVDEPEVQKVSDIFGDISLTQQTSIGEELERQGNSIYYKDTEEGEGGLYNEYTTEEEAIKAFEALTQQTGGTMTVTTPTTAETYIDGTAGNQTIVEIDPNKLDEDIDIKFRKYEELDASTQLISDVEKQWFLSRFGEEGLTVMDRLKYMTLKNGKQAFGYYQRGMVTVAEMAPTGTMYWEAFRRIYDLHLTPEEKSAIEMEVIEKLQSEFQSDTIAPEIDIQTRLAEEFMKYRLNEDESGLGATIKKFFKELLYYIKNMLGMNSEIEILFRDISNRDFILPQEDAELQSQVQTPVLREKTGFTVEQVDEIVGVMNYNLKNKLQEQYGDKWLEVMKDPKLMKSVYTQLRQGFEETGTRLQASENETLKKIGNNFALVAQENNWKDKVDDLNNLVSPGFESLAVKALDNQFGIKYKIKRDGKVDTETVPFVEEATTEVESNDDVSLDEQVALNEEQSKERIHGVNYYHSSTKPTLSKDIKIELGFIKSEKGKFLGSNRYLPFDEVYAYLSVALANTPGGNVLNRLEQLAEKGHPMASEVLTVYGSSSPQWQNKFVAHFNKQNIQFKTLLLDDSGETRTILTNRNGLKNQIINIWNSNRLDSAVFQEENGENDLIDLTEVDKIRTSYDTLLPLLKNQGELTDQQHKGQYLRIMKDTLDMMGITFDNVVWEGIFNDETIKAIDLEQYMRGTNSFGAGILRALERGVSPYMAGNMESAALKNLAELAVDYTIDNYIASFMSGNKKPIYAINLNTYDSKTTLELSSDETYEAAILSRYNDVFYSPTENHRHLILDLLFKNPEVRANFALSTFDVVKEKNTASRSNAYDTMSQKLSAISRFAMFYNNGFKYGEFNTGTKGDKTQWKFLSLPKIGPENTALGLWKSGKPGLDGWYETGVQLLMPAALGEMARIAKTNDQISGNNPIALSEQIQSVHYKKNPGDQQGNGTRFVQFPQLNNPKYKIFDEGGLIRKGVNASSMAQIEELRIGLKEGLLKYLQDNVQQTITAFAEAGAINVNGTSITNESLPISALRGDIINNDITTAMTRFAVNDLVYKTYMQTTFGPDLAYYKTDDTGNPIIEAGKRAYQSITPGLEPVWNEQKQFGLKPKFSHTILKDIFKDGDTARFQKILENAGVETKEAKRIATAYTKINKTDAQGFTTLEFHKHLMESEGTWTQEHENAYDKYWTKGLMGDIASRKLLLNPRKTYYFGERLVTDSQGNNTVTFEQIKHSTIPLIREFTEMFKGTEDQVSLNNLRQRMEGTGRYKGLETIDMANFESAIKVGASGIENIDNLQGLNVEILETKNLRSPQVIETKTKAPLDGTQMAKLILSNILDSYNYNVFGGKYNGKQIKDLYNEIYAERIKRSHDSLTKELGWDTYQNTLNLTDLKARDKAQLDFLLKVKDVAINSLEERDLPDNYYLAMKIEKLVDDVNAYGFQAPLSFPPFAKRFESILLSLFKNKVLKQRFNGMSVVQVAEFGFELDTQLEIKAHKNGGVYAEVALPYELAAKLGLKPGDTVDSNVDPQLFEIMGYRIPTQGKNSMLSLKITKILPENMGGVIILPAEITTMMGSDFDIDKMYLMFPEISKAKTKINAFNAEIYSGKKEFDGVSDKALTNALFDIRQSIITSKNHVKELMDPLDSNTYTLKLAEYEKLGIVPNLSDLNINSTAADMYLEKINKDAALLIGLFSLHSTGHAVAQDMDVKLKDDFAVNIQAEGSKSHTDLSRILGFNGQFISSYISENQNEALDNAKYQRIGRAGVSVYNNGIVALLNRIGFSNEGVALDFINQPILREFFATRNLEEEKTDYAIAKDLAKKYEMLDTFELLREQTIHTPSAASLKKDLGGTLADKELAKRQTQILSDMLKYLQAGRDLAKFNMIVSPETLKNFSRLSFLEQFNNNVAYLNSEVSSINIGNTTGRIQAYINYGIKAAESFTGQFVPFNGPGFSLLKTNIAQLTGQRDTILSADLSDVINSFGLFYSLTKRTSPFGDLLYNKRDALEKKLFNKPTSLLNDVIRIKKQYNLQNDPFLGMLYNSAENTGRTQFLQTIAFNNTTKLSPAQKNKITDRWSELLMDPRAEVRNLAQDLVRYSVLTSGFMLGPNSFVDLVPMSYWKSSGLTDFFRKEERGMGYANYFDEGAAEQIIRNMFTDRNLLKTVDSKNLVTTDPMRKTLSMSQNEYFLHEDANSNLVVPSVDPLVSEYVKYFKSFNEGKFRLYKHVRDSKTGAIYEEIQPLGERFKYVEMAGETLMLESIHPLNKVVNPAPSKQLNPTITEITEEQNPGNTQSINDVMPQLTPIVKESVLADLDARLETWLLEHFNIPVEKYDNLKQKLGIDAIGAADMAMKTVQIQNDRDRYTLPEEAGHFYIEMMDQSPLKTRLFELVGQTKLYQDVLKEYKDIYTTNEQFINEAAGKVLSRYIVGQELGIEPEFVRGSGLMNTLRNLWESIKRFFRGGNTAANDLSAQLSEVLGPAAVAITSGVNPGGLSIENIGVNKYYALQPQNITGLAAQLLKRGSALAASKIPYLKNFTQRDAMNQLIGESNMISAPTEQDNYYVQDGVKMNRVSRLLEIFQDPFNQQDMAEKVAATNRGEGNVFNTADKVQKLWDFLRDDLGTGLHNMMEQIVQQQTDDVILSSVPQEQRKSFEKALPSLKAWVAGKIDSGSTLYSEVKIADKSDLLAGSVDIIEITPTGRKIIHDFKTKMRGKFGNIEQSLPSFKGALASVPNTLLNKYRLQLSLYKHIIEEKGITIDELNIVPLEADVTMNSEGTISFSNVGLATSNTPVINKLNNLKPISKKVIKGAISYISPEFDASNKKIEKEQDTVLRVFENAKNQIQRKIDFYKKSNNKEYSDQLQELYNELDEIGEKEGLIVFTKRAVRDINSAHARLKELVRNNAVTPKNLNQIYQFVKSYDSLEEITLMAPMLVESGFENMIEKYVMPAIAKKNLVYEEYKALGRPLIAEALAKLSTNPNVTVDKLEAELLTSGRDISFMARWLDSLGDSTQTELATMDKLIVLQRGKVNEATYNLMYGTKTTKSLMKLMKDLEKFQFDNGVNLYNNRAVYDFMLEVGTDGNMTGKVVTTQDSRWLELKQEFMETENFTNSKEDWASFYKENKAEDYRSQKFKDIANMAKEDPRRMFYEFYAENYMYAQKLLPTKYRKGAQLPSLRATAAEKVLEKKGSFPSRLKDAAKEMWTETFTKHEDNVSYGEYVDSAGNPLDFVPVHYSRAIGNQEGQLSPADLSYDLGSGLKMFFTMANNFKEMSEILDVLEVGKELIKTRRVTKLSSGMAKKDQIGEVVTTAGVDSRAYARLSDYFDMQIYGKRKKDMGAVTIMGKEIDIAQSLDAFLQAGSFRVLALNKHAGLSNATFGEMMSFIEGYANQHYGVGNYARATAIYAAGIAGLTNDVMKRQPSSKLGMINELYDVQQHFDEYGNRLEHRKIGLRASGSALFFMMSLGEHVIQTQMAVASMLNTKFKTSKGEVNLYDAYSVVDGRLELDPEVEAQFSSEDRVLFAEKNAAAYQRIHGIYNTKDRNALQQYAMGRWAMQFRKWLRPGMLRRFQGAEKLFYNKDSKFKGPEYNERLQSFVEGNYVTALKFVNRIKKEVFAMRFQTLPQQWEKLEKFEQENIRRALGESAGYMILVLLGSAVGFGYDPDDEEGSDNMTALDWQMLYNVKRVQAEMGFYTTSSFFEILRTPAANMTTIEAYYKFIEQLMSDGSSLMFGGDYDRYKRDAGRYKKDDPKILKRFHNILPGKELFTKPEDKLSWFDLK